MPIGNPAQVSHQAKGSEMKRTGKFLKGTSSARDGKRAAAIEKRAHVAGQRIAAIAAACVLTLACVLALPGRAFAAATQVSGIDYYYGGADDQATDDNSVAVLSVDGDEDTSVYVKVEKDGKVIADRLLLTFDKGSVTKDSDGSYAGSISVDIDGFDPTAATYTITAYADRAETTALYTGTVVPVYAQLDGGESVLLGLRTIGESDADRTFTAPATFEYGNQSYQLASADPTSTSPLTYAYTKTSTEAVDGTITFVDADGKTISTQAIKGITASEPQTVDIPAFVVADDGTYYYTLGASQVTASIDGSTSFVISCRPFQHVDKAYRAKIVAVDADDNVLFTDSVLVSRSYIYTMPSELSLKSSNEVAEYVLDTSDEHLEKGTNQLVLSTTDNTEGKQEITYKVRYTKQDSSASQTWTVNVINGTADPKDAGRVISTQTLTATPDTPAEFDADPSITIDGTEYVPASKQTHYTYTYGSGGSNVLNIYYVPKDYVAEKDYDVTINYVNIATGKVVGSKTVTVPAGITEDLQIETPESFQVGNITYLRLAGQDAPIQHGYYTGYRTYTVYYRDSRDNLNANTVITTVVVRYTQGATTPGATATTGTTANGAANGNGTAIGATAGQSLSTANGANGTGDATLTTPDGQTLEEQRIDDNTTPLAGPTAGGALATITSNPGAIAGLVIALVAAVCLIVLFVKRHKKDETPADDSTKEGGR